MFRMPRLLALAAAALLLTGCATQSIALHSQSGYPSEYDIADPFADDPAAFWSADRATFDVVAFASSSCDPIPDTIEAISSSEIALHFVKPAGSCTADISSTTFTFTTPKNVAGDVTIEITIGTKKWTVPIT